MTGLQKANVVKEEKRVAGERVQVNKADLVAIGTALGMTFKAIPKVRVYGLAKQVEEHAAEVYRKLKAAEKEVATLRKRLVLADKPASEQQGEP